MQLREDVAKAIAVAVAYTAACALAHYWLEWLHYTECRRSLFAIYRSGSGPFCHLLDRGVRFLAYSPLQLCAKLAGAYA